MVALQGQDLAGVLHSIALRTAGSTIADVRRAFDAGALVRSWPMRGTLHVTTPGDLRILLRLTADRQRAQAATRRRQLGIERTDEAAATDAVLAALAERTTTGSSGAARPALTRAEVFAAFEAAGQETSGQRGTHLLGLLATEGVVALGPFRERATGAAPEQLIVALDDAGAQRALETDPAELVAGIALRYIRSHGPASERDLAWWTKLPLTLVRAALEANANELEVATGPGGPLWLEGGLLDDRGGSTAGPPRSGRPHVALLPGFDELILGYGDRSGPLDDGHSEIVVPGGNGMFLSTVSLGGRVVGTWRRARSSSGTTVTVHPFSSFSAATLAGIERAGRGYGRLLDQTVRIEVEPEGPTTSAGRPGSRS